MKAIILIPLILLQNCGKHVLHANTFLSAGDRGRVNTYYFAYAVNIFPSLDNATSCFYGNCFTSTPIIWSGGFYHCPLLPPIHRAGHLTQSRPTRAPTSPGDSNCSADEHMTQEGPIRISMLKGDKLCSWLPWPPPHGSVWENDAINQRWEDRECWWHSSLTEVLEIPTATERPLTFSSVLWATPIVFQTISSCITYSLSWVSVP